MISHLDYIMGRAHLHATRDTVSLDLAEGSRLVRVVDAELINLLATRTTHWVDVELGTVRIRGERWCVRNCWAVRADLLRAEDIRQIEHVQERWGWGTQATPEEVDAMIAGVSLHDAPEYACIAESLMPLLSGRGRVVAATSAAGPCAVRLYRGRVQALVMATLRQNAARIER
jgi:hypothetical protein